MAMSRPNKAGQGVEVGAAARKKAWARLPAKVYEVDPILCPNCGGKMAVIAVIRLITEPRGTDPRGSSSPGRYPGKVLFGKNPAPAHLAADMVAMGIYPDR